ncbi:hypothetical protein ElyMa_000494300 [Elysia marginata]|uniref:Uncharacterized protein n=1 Tax=Elysia marginata TaxID=1093978 RepID=A0AAV4FTQ2_9GAST|nr:hypothetical protein ElyMa_000494300 [Elysia marginata]
MLHQVASLDASAVNAGFTSNVATRPQQSSNACQVTINGRALSALISKFLHLERLSPSPPLHSLLRSPFSHLAVLRLSLPPLPLPPNPPTPILNPQLPPKLKRKTIPSE